MARNTLKLETSGFEEAIRRLENLGGDVKQAVSDGLTDAAAKIAIDTEKALTAPSLPARGKYSSGDTKKSIVRDQRVEWDGSIAYIPVGFDFSKPGAGGFLITGTPRMSPDKALHRIYKEKRYMTQIGKVIENQITNYIIRRMTQ